MTWRKTGSEFDDECALADLSNGAYRTHQEAIGFIYTVEQMSCRFPKRNILRFAASPSLSDDVSELVGAGFWRDHGAEYEVIHHADVIRQSLAAQSGKRERDKKAQRRHRSKTENPTDGTTSVSADVSADVSGDTDRQTDKQLGSRVPTTCRHGYHPDREQDPWLQLPACEQCQTKTARRSA